MSLKKKEKRVSQCEKEVVGVEKGFFLKEEEERKDIPNKRKREEKKKSMMPSITTTTTTISLFLFIFPLNVV